jgi:hypothetical protein
MVRSHSYESEELLTLEHVLLLLILLLVIRTRTEGETHSKGRYAK